MLYFQHNTTIPIVKFFVLPCTKQLQNNVKQRDKRDDFGIFIIGRDNNNGCVFGVQIY